MSDYINSLSEQQQLAAILEASRHEDLVEAPPGFLVCHTASEFRYNGQFRGRNLCWFIAIADGLRKTAEERWIALQCLGLVDNVNPLDPTQRENVAKHWQCCVVEHDAGSPEHKPRTVGPRDAVYVVHVHLKTGHYNLLIQESEVELERRREEERQTDGGLRARGGALHRARSGGDIDCRRHNFSPVQETRPQTFLASAQTIFASTQTSLLNTFSQGLDVISSALFSADTVCDDDDYDYNQFVLDSTLHASLAGF